VARRLPVLCSQEYLGVEMRTAPCTRCSVGWDRAAGRCSIPMGVEHLPLTAETPECPIADRCQHQIQSGSAPCPVRARGLVCESALRAGGDPRPEDSPIGFNACVVAGPGEF